MKIPKFLKNKFYLALTIFGVYMLFFNDADVFSVFNHHQEIDKLEKEIDWYKEQTLASQQRLEQLEKGGFELEKLAREKHYLQKDNEDVFVVSSSSNQ